MKKISLLFILLSSLFWGCNRTSNDSSSKDASIRRYNMEMAKEQKGKQESACDTLALVEHIINEDTAGTYLVKFDRTLTYNVPKYAVIYHTDKKNKKQYIFAVIAKSKKGERLIEPKNVIGFSSSFVNLDSTKLGTAFFFLTMYECHKDSSEPFVKLWEAEVPIHGGFNSMKLKKWKPKNLLYVELNFDAGIISGHRNYNFFFVDGILEEPHLMETYLGLVHKRTMANINDDEYPDYWEYRFWDDSISIRVRDSIPFYWSKKKDLYITKYNRRWYRKY